MRNIIREIALGSAILAASAAAQQPMPVRPLGPIVARARDTLGNSVGIRPLSDGRILLVDRDPRRLELRDSSLAITAIIADSTGATAKAYGNAQGSPGTLVPYRGDTTLFLDEAALGFLVIDPSGKIGRTIAVPQPNRSSSIWAYGPAGSDPQGRLLYRGDVAPAPRPPANLPAGAAPPQAPDSAPILRFDFSTRTLDTLTFIKVHVGKRAPMIQLANGMGVGYSYQEPFYFADDWAALSDGSVAIVHAQDLHIEFYDPFGTHTIAPKLPFRWQPVNDSLKEWLVDSMTRADSTRRASLPATSPIKLVPFPIIPAADIPDYRPPVVQLYTRADRDGDLWIKQTVGDSAGGGPIYLVVNREGKLIDHVQLPGGTILTAVGPGGAVYLMARVGTGQQLVRARLR